MRDVVRHAACEGLTKATCRRGSEAYAGSVPYEASNMQKSGETAGDGFAKPRQNSWALDLQSGDGTGARG